MFLIWHHAILFKQAGELDFLPVRTKVIKFFTIKKLVSKWEIGLEASVLGKQRQL